MVLSDGYQPSAAADGGAVVRAMAKSAAHVINTGTSRLHAVFCAAGPGLPAGLDLGLIDNTAVAPFVLERVEAGAAALAAAGRLE